jgi:hypothetical protein
LYDIKQFFGLQSGLSSGTPSANPELPIRNHWLSAFAEKNSCLTDVSDEQAEYIKTIEDHCFQLLEHEKKLISILFLDCYRQSFSTTQLN